MHQYLYVKQISKNELLYKELELNSMGKWKYYILAQLKRAEERYSLVL